MNHDGFKVTRPDDWGPTSCRCECGIRSETYPSACAAMTWHDSHRLHPNKDADLATGSGPFSVWQRAALAAARRALP